MGLMDMLKTSDPMAKFYAAAEKSNVPQGGITGKLFSAMFPHGLGNLAFGREPEPMPPLETPEGTALMADLASNMMVPGTFIGPKGLARLFGDDAAKGIIATAENKLAQGVPKEAVFQELGVFKGPEGKWRYEIDDSGMQLSEAASKRFTPGVRHVLGEKYAKSVPDTMTHPELISAYPQWMRDIEVRETPDFEGGSFYSRPHAFDAGREVGVVEMAQSGSNPQSTLLHELQHAVQEREGFARGGSPASMADEIGGARLRADELRQKMEIAKNVIADEARWVLADPSKKDFVRKATDRWQSRLGKLGDDNPYGVDERMAVQFELEEADDTLRRWAQEYNDARNQAMNDPMDMYQRLAGEAEARAVQDRMNMNMDERRALFPEYAGRSDLIVRGLMSGGK